MKTAHLYENHEVTAAICEKITDWINGNNLKCRTCLLRQSVNSVKVARMTGHRTFSVTGTGTCTQQLHLTTLSAKLTIYIRK